MTTWDDTRLTLQERCAVGTSRGIADAQRAKCEAWLRSTPQGTPSRLPLGSMTPTFRRGV